MSLLPKLLPISLMEGYETTVQESQRIFGPPSHVVRGMYGTSEVENEFLARCLTGRRRVAFAQHGGSYGQLKVHGGFPLEAWPETRFLSWGWTGPGVTPLPSPRLSRIRDGHQGGHAVAIIEGEPVDEAVAHIGFSSIRFRRGLQLPEDLSRFVEAVGDDDLRSHLVHKPYPTVDRSTSAVQLMRRARVAVITYLDTPFLEALALNVPVIAFWDPSVYELNDDSRERLDELGRLGVLHDDPVDAAGALRSVYPWADTWWRQPPIQHARLSFLDSYGLSQHFTSAWTRYLRSFIREAGRGPK